MSLWSDYLAELRGPEYRVFLEDTEGFVAYSMPYGDGIVIHDMYVVPAKRGTGKGRAMFEHVCEIGRRAGRKFVLAEIELSTLTATETLKAHLAVDLVPISVYNDSIIMRKELADG